MEECTCALGKLLIESLSSIGGLGEEDRNRPFGESVKGDCQYSETYLRVTLKRIQGLGARMDIIDFTSIQIFYRLAPPTQ